MTRCDDPELESRRVFIEIIDSTVMQLKTRFKDLETVEFIELLDSKKYKAYKENFPDKLIVNLAKTYGRHFNLSRLKNELKVVYSQGEFNDLHLHQLVQHLQDSELNKALPEFYKLVSLIATIPCTSASVERSFSALKRIKSYLRGTMGEERLSQLALMNIEAELLMSCKTSPHFYDKIIDKFAKDQNRRIDLMYQ